MQQAERDLKNASAHQSLEDAANLGNRENGTWDPLQQMSTMPQALKAAASQGTGDGAPATSGRDGQQNRSHLWHIDHRRCMTSLGQAVKGSTNPTDAQTAENVQQPHAVFSVYVHSTAGVPAAT